MIELTDEEIDVLLERFDQTDPALQRRIIARFITRGVAADDLLAALKGLMAVQDCTDDCWCNEGGGTCEACVARAAIAKAESPTQGANE